MPSITIARRYCGPPESGNGGYVCGRLAAFIDGPAVVRLHAPPPLDELFAVNAAGAAVEMMRGGEVLATARPARVDIEPPPPPTYAEAEHAMQSYAGFRAHAFPGCFVCGPARAAGDGLRIYPGRYGERRAVASAWVPDASIADADGRIPREFVWAALDCPGAFSFDTAPGTPLLLGELAAALTGEIRAGERCIAVGWEISRDGRRHRTGTAVYTERGERRGIALATWFEMPSRSHGAVT